MLNFKGIPYTQSWVSYPDIKPLITGFGLPPNETGIPYTLPAIVDKSTITSNPHGAMMDSLPIALHLDKAYPSPSLFPSGDVSYALTLAVGRIITLMMPAFKSLVMPRVPEKLDPRGRDYFIQTRSEWFGQPLAECRPTDEASIKELHKLVETELGTLVQMLKGREGKKGPFFEGEKAGFADLMVACVLAFYELFDAELFDKAVSIGDGELKALFDACKPWLHEQGQEKEWPIPQ